MTVKDIRPRSEVHRFLEHVRTSADNPSPGASCWRHRKKDGTLIDIEVTSFAVAFAGRQARFVTVRDLTEQKRSEAMNRFHAVLLATMDDAVLAWDTSFILTGWNAAAVRTYGWTAEEVLGRPVSAIVVEDPARDWAERIRELVERGFCYREATHVRRDGSRIRVEARATALVDASGKRSGYVSVNRDITARRQSEEIVRALLNQVVGAQEDERRRVARELHDDAAQALAGLMVKLGAIEGAESVEAARAGAKATRKQVAAALEGVQRIARGLRPPALDDLGLDEALERLARELAETHGLRVDTAVCLENLRLPSAVETTLYRIAQETLTNVAKHARARTVSIVLRRAPARVVLIVDDDGQGFNADQICSTRHLGLQGMRERVALLGGSLLVESAPGSGTRIHVSIPFGGSA